MECDQGFPADFEYYTVNETSHQDTLWKLTTSAALNQPRSNIRFLRRATFDNRAALVYSHADFYTGCGERSVC